MIRFLFRFIGLVLLAAAFILVIYDGTKSIAGNALSLTSLRTLWLNIDAASIENLKPLIVERVGAFVWDPLFVAVLDAPSWAVLGIVGIFMIMLGRHKKPLIGYAR